MTSDRWTALQDLYLAACDLPPHEQAAFVRQRADGDDDLQREVLSLLAASPPPLLDAQAVRALDPESVAELLADLAPGTFVGPYRVLGEAGRGGMGTVYRAERADGTFEQTVALKLVKRGMDSAAVLRRFHAERRILARLDHPGIARVLDGGRAADGRPWLAMEFVEGEPITDYCDRHGLTVARRIGLFQQVCEAVGYAHRNLIVHRDLKPSNVLVTPEGGPGGGPGVKLLDFGIAKVLADDEDAPMTVLTGPGQLVLTPEYAAPEQVTGGPISTATDVYALGVILYELLAGQRPYGFDARTPGVIEHVVRTVQPPRPSTVVGGTETHGTPPDRLRRQLAGDLDTICLTALRKEPERRYTSVEALADDLHRHRDGLPVLARPDTVGYRARKFVRRHRVGLAATVASLVAVGLVAGLAFVRVSAERDRARTEAGKATQVSAFLADLFGDADPSETQGDSALVVDVLDRGAARVRAELADQPEVQGMLLRVIGDVYATLGRHGEAEGLLTDALALHRGLAPPAPDEVALSTAALARLRNRTGDYAAADSLFGEVIALRTATRGADAPETALALVDLGQLRYDTGRFDEADSLARAALALQRRAAPDALDLAATLDLLGVLAEEAGEHARADSLAQRVLALRRTRLDPPHRDLAEALLNAGLAKRNRERYDEAEAYYLESLAMRRALYGDAHPDVAYTLNHLASLEVNRERYAAAERYAREGLALREAAYGPDHIEVAASLGNLARIQEAGGDLDATRRTLDRAYAIVRSSLGPDHPFNGAMLHRLGEVDAAQGRRAAAEAKYRQALRVYRAVWPEGHLQIGLAALSLGTLLADDRPREARAVLEDGLRSCQTAPEEPACAERVDAALAALRGG